MCLFLQPQEPTRGLQCCSVEKSERESQGRGKSNETDAHDASDAMFRRTHRFVYFLRHSLADSTRPRQAKAAGYRGKAITNTGNFLSRAKATA